MYKEVSDQKTLNEESYHCFISKVTLKLSPDSCSQYITYLQWVTKILSSNYFLKFCGCLLVVCSHFLVLCNHLCTATCTEEAIQMAAKCLQQTNIYIYIYIYIYLYIIHIYIYIYIFIYNTYIYIYIYIYYSLYKRIFTTDPLHALFTFLWLPGRKMNSTYALESYSFTSL